MVKPVCGDRLFRGTRAQHLVVRRHIVRVGYHNTSKVSDMTHKTRKTSEKRCPCRENAGATAAIAGRVKEMEAS